jgi:hypothetical protein
MGKGRDKWRRNAKKLGKRTKEEEEIVRAIEAEVEYRLKRIRKRSSSSPPSDPPVLDEPDAPVRAPLKPRPNLRSGAVAVSEPEPEEVFSVIRPTVFPKQLIQRCHVH